MPTQPQAQMVPYEPDPILRECLHCGTVSETVEANEAHEAAKTCKQPVASIEIGTTLVRLSHLYATKTAQKVVYRITAGPDPTARRKAERECWQLQPAGGGAFTRAPLDALLAASADDKVRYAHVQPAARLCVGTVVEQTRVVLRGESLDQMFVIIGEKPDGTVALARLGGDGGRSFRNTIPVSALQAVPLPEVAARLAS